MNGYSFRWSLSFVVLFSGCSAGGHGRDTYPGADWVVSTPLAEGLDAAALEVLRAQQLDDPDLFTQSLIVVKNGVIVGEWYGDGTDATTDSTSWSMGKSFASTLVGIAIDRGFVPSLDTPLATWFPTWVGGVNEAITLRALLEMRSGLPWDVPGYGDFELAFVDGDQLAFSRDRVAVNAPGAIWHYSSGDSMLMSGVLASATGMDVTAFAEESLFGPIGMDVRWWRDAAGNTLTYCCIDTTPRDFARFGLLLARDGVWKGRQIVSQEYLAQATMPLSNMRRYGLQFWLIAGTYTVDGQPIRVFYADGKDHQHIYVAPDVDMVVVRTGKYTRLGADYVLGHDGNFILTNPPATWNDEEFVRMALSAIDPDVTFTPDP